MKYISRWSEGFRIPSRMMAWLEERTAGERFRVQAIALAGLVMRVWAAPKNIGKPIYLSRPEVASLLGVSDWEARKAIELLVAVGFIHRDSGGEPARRTARGIRRPPIVYRLCALVLTYFRKLLQHRPPVSTATREELSSLKKEESLTSEGILTGGAQRSCEAGRLYSFTRCHQPIV